MQKVEEIRNFKGKTVATVHFDSRSGRYYIYDFLGKNLGYFDPKDARGKGRTYNFYGKIISTGNSLTSLIEDWD